MKVMKRSIPLGGGMWGTRWYVVKDMLDETEIPVAMFTLEEEAVLWVSSYEKQWESKDE